MKEICYYKTIKIEIEMFPEYVLKLIYSLNFRT